MGAGGEVGLLSVLLCPREAGPGVYGGLDSGTREIEVSIIMFIPVKTLYPVFPNLYNHLYEKEA